MKVILYNAISADGFIAKKNGDSSWVDSVDWNEFASFIKASGIIVMGKNTYIESGEDFPYKDAINIVLTSDTKLHKKSNETTIFSKMTPLETIEFASSRKFKSILLIGGGLLNGSFLNLKLIDEMVLCVHPLIIGSGIKLFENTHEDPLLELISTKKLENDLVQLRYKVRI